MFKLRADQCAIRIKLSEVMSALSYALDLVEGQPEGHAVRACLIGSRIGQLLKLSDDDKAALFYAMLMKDLGCSSNAAKMCFLFAADDRATKGQIKTVNWRNPLRQAKFALKHVAPGSPIFNRIRRMIGLLVSGHRAGKELIQIRCERGAAIARLLGLSESTADAIHALDEHYDGGGHPEGLLGDDIPLLGRIMGVAQTAEVFFRQGGREAMRGVVRDRRGTWFDPHLSTALLSLKDDDVLWQQLADPKPARFLKVYETSDEELQLDDERFDNIALGFASVVDAKSPWTFRHSIGVADVAVGIAKELGLPFQQIRDLKRAALLHDIGKLGVSNLILDKPGKLTPEELTAMRLHSKYTQDILTRVAGFSGLAELAASHHEKLDGHGYHRGLSGMQLTQDIRILCVADMYEALAAKRPYREDMSEEQVFAIIQKNTPHGLCPVVVEALTAFIKRGQFVPYQVAA